MFIKQREVPSELKITRFLQHRMNWTEKETRQLVYDEKGFEGEVFVDHLIEKFPDDNYLAIGDFLFEFNSSYAQIDTLLLMANKLILFEIKNKEGDHYYEEGKLFTASGYELKSPFEQSDRAEALFRKKLQSFGIKIPIDSYILFVHPEFTLYQAPMTIRKLVLPTQLNAFFKKLEANLSPVSRKQIDLSQKLLNFHQPDSPFKRLPNYTYEELKKGLYCESCTNFSLSPSDKKIVCQTCKHEESIKHAVLRGVEEFHILFPNHKITLSRIKDWCRLEISDRSYQHVLSSNLVVKNHGRYSYYILAEKTYRKV
ncbi:nuclease-related domain-containing protein [Pullulanibacillus sp. KACC 23026]|uniref:nuclease-related domain-containing protein n=1 Tax=Pullulanibacillus sp. KACC 23026 TaxID=3028315 RepID=UPI0023AF7290|nr:nuclease-related domain-containing protein [Pullulanibacillus sp. KACC 23026]WEG13817.1 nuclease-related domain-containing protein [Pullulanibacillus sp. KACC 23026]